ncbi:MAG: hypothetical protein EZS28_001195 [Streblomastix strix]|uniref:Uncharacterized protein n=1 Tax=Streblomastix strix TaxID=222440 RepID=A0A5J4X898_9EUKA|nr:MAG: hypothetical protein EZS28_001195 [Streblomastix strix]
MQLAVRQARAYASGLFDVAGNIAEHETLVSRRTKRIIKPIEFIMKDINEPVENNSAFIEIFDDYFNQKQLMNKQNNVSKPPLEKLDDKQSKKIPNIVSQTEQSNFSNQTNKLNENETNENREQLQSIAYQFHQIIYGSPNLRFLVRALIVSSATTHALKRSQAEIMESVFVLEYEHGLYMLSKFFFLFPNSHRSQQLSSILSDIHNSNYCQEINRTDNFPFHQMIMHPELLNKSPQHDFTALSFIQWINEIQLNNP